MLTLLTDTVFGNGKTPDYLLLGNMVYTVSVELFFGASGPHICVLFVLRPSRPYNASVCPAEVIILRNVLGYCSTRRFLYETEQVTCLSVYSS